MEGAAGQAGLGLSGCEHDNDSKPRSVNSELLCSNEESGHRTKNNFCQANKNHLFRPSYQ